MAAFDEETLAKLDKKLIAAGYTDGEWRSIMFRYYGEDYEGMGERARLRADERQRRKMVMDVTTEIENMGAHGLSELDLAVPGGTQQMVERNGPVYFPVKPLSPQKRNLTFAVQGPTEPIGKTIGTHAPGRHGVGSQGLLNLVYPPKEEGEEGEAAEEAPPAEGEEDGEKKEGDGAPAQDEIDEDELMFIWNRRQAPQHRREQVAKELDERLSNSKVVEEYLYTQYAEAKAADDEFLATAGVSKEHPTGTLANGQQTSFLPNIGQVSTNAVWEGTARTVRWGLEVDGEQQPEERIGMLPLGRSQLHLDPKIIRDNKLVSTQADVRQAQEDMLRESLGHSRLEMPADQDPHYMTPTLFKAAHSLTAASAQFPRPTQTAMTERTELTKTALQGLDAEARERVSKVQEKLKGQVIKDPGEQLDIPALLLRKFNYLRNPRHATPATHFVEELSTIVTKAGAGTEPVMGRNEFVLASPGVVTFDRYEVGEVYEAPLKLLNTSKTLRRIKVLPPAGDHFSVSLTQYLGEDGLVAPGLFALVHVRFRPDTLADFHDTLWVVTEGGIIGVPLIAKREPPNLTLPDTVDVGNCFIYDRRSVSVMCRNQGGEGRFLLVADSEWPDAPDDVHTRDSVEVAPCFTVSPGSFALNTGESVEIKVDFCPRADGTITGGFRLVCDNCSVHRYVLSGTSFHPEIHLHSMDGMPVGGELAEQTQPVSKLNFPALAPRATSGKNVVLRNDTPLPMVYHWEVTSVDTPGTRMKAYTGKWGRVGETHTVFGVASDKGTLFPKTSSTFQVTFAPKDVVEYAAVARMYVHDLPREGESSVGGGEVYETVLMCTLHLSGSGGEVNVILEPPIMVLSQRMSVGKTYRRTVAVTNKSSGPTDLKWEEFPDILYQAVKIVPPKLTLQAMEKREIRVEVTPKAVGRLEATLGCEVQNGAGLGFALFADVSGPQLKLSEANIDFGLMRVGDSEERTLTITNVCDIMARWHIEVVEEGGGEAMSASIEYAPQKGLLDANRSVVIKIKHKPTAPARTRATVIVHTEGGNPLFISLRGEAIYPKVSLSDSTVDLGTIFLAVPVTRRLFMRNRTLLPATRFSWQAAASGPLSVASSPVISIKFAVVNGALGPDDTVPVDFTVEALTLGDPGDDDDRPGDLGSASRPGLMEALVPLDVEGMPNPAGFCLKAEVMGLAVTYHAGSLETVPAVPDDIKGTPAALDVGVKRDWAEELLGPDVDAPCVIDFGTGPVLEKHSRTLLLRNHTGISSAYTVRVERFGVASHEILLAEQHAQQQMLLQHPGSNTQGSRNARTPPSRGGTSHGGGGSPPRTPGGTTTIGGGHSTVGSHLGGGTSVHSGFAAGGGGMGRSGMSVTQSGVSIGTNITRKGHKVTRQNGTVATVRMGGVLSRAVATGPAARSVTEAEVTMRQQRASSKWLREGYGQLEGGLREGHAKSRLEVAASHNDERRRMQSSALWHLPGDHTGVATARGKEATDPARAKIVLGDDHEDSERFRGAAGQELLNRRAEAEEAQQMLEDGQGAAITCSSYQGALPAWGEVEIRIDLYSDMAAVVRDRIEVEVMGLQPVIIPVVAVLTGTPVKLEGGTLGVHRREDEVPRVDFGDVLLGGNPIYRNVRVANSGPWPVMVDWRLLEGGENGTKDSIHLMTSVDDDGNVVFSATAVDPVEADPEGTPFKIDPPMLEVPPHSTRSTVLSCQWDSPQFHSYLLEGQVRPICPEPKEGEPESTVDPDDASLHLVKSLPCAHAPLSLDSLVLQVECNVQGAFLETDCHKHLRWQVSSTKDWRAHPSYFRSVNLSNRSRANLSFSIKVNPPFSIENTICTAPLHPMAKPLPAETSLMNAPPPQLFTLPPNDNVQVKLRFTPPAKHRSGRVVDDALIFGEMQITFANEEEQMVRLQAHMLHPEIMVSPSEVNFQTLHVESVAALTLSFKNDTFCDANWSIVHQPKTLASSMSRTANTNTMASTGTGGMEATSGLEFVGVDDPSVFSFDPPSGTVKGKGNRPTIAASKVITVRFSPNAQGLFMSRFKVAVDGGRSAVIVLTGTGSYAENDEPGGSTGVIRDHPGYSSLLTGVRGPVVPNENTYGADMNATEHPAPQQLPGWYDMDKAMPPMHMTRFTGTWGGGF